MRLRNEFNPQGGTEPSSPTYKQLGRLLPPTCAASRSFQAPARKFHALEQLTRCLPNRSALQTGKPPTTFAQCQSPIEASPVSSKEPPPGVDGGLGKAGSHAGSPAPPRACGPHAAAAAAAAGARALSAGRGGRRASRLTVTQRFAARGRRRTRGGSLRISRAPGGGWETLHYFRAAGLLSHRPPPLPCLLCCPATSVPLPPGRHETPESGGSLSRAGAPIRPMRVPIVPPSLSCASWGRWLSLSVPAVLPL